MVSNTSYNSIEAVRDVMLRKLFDHGIITEKDRTEQDSDSSSKFTFTVGSQTFMLRIFLHFNEQFPSVVIARPMKYGSIYKCFSSEWIDRELWLEFIDITSNLPPDIVPDSIGGKRLAEYLNTEIYLEKHRRIGCEFMLGSNLYYDEENRQFQVVSGSLNLSDKRILSLDIHYYNDDELECHFSRYFDNPNSNITQSVVVFRTRKDLLSSYIYWALVEMEI